MILSLLATGMSMTSVANDNGSAFLRAGSRRTAEDTCDSISKFENIDDGLDFCVANAVSTKI